MIIFENYHLWRCFHSILYTLILFFYNSSRHYIIIFQPYIFLSLAKVAISFLVCPLSKLTS